MTLVPPTDAPRHGFRGDSVPQTEVRPRGLTVALSREAGSRGATVARHVGELLGWQVYDQEMLDFLANDESARAELLADVPASAHTWADERLAALDSLEPQYVPATRLALTLAAVGDAVLIGRGSGFLLPSETTIHVRLVAPLDQRIGYMAERLRLSWEDAAREVENRDRKRSELLFAITGQTQASWTGYDLILNSARLGVEICAELIVQTVRLKQLQIGSPTSSDTDDLGAEPA